MNTTEHVEYKLVEKGLRFIENCNVCVCVIQNSDQ